MTGTGWGAEGLLVTLMRHGQSEWNAEDRFQGSTDHSKLTPKGHAQAVEAATRVG